MSNSSHYCHFSNALATVGSASAWAAKMAKIWHRAPIFMIFRSLENSGAKDFFETKNIDF